MLISTSTKKDLDGDLQTELALAEEVTDHLAKGAKTAAGGAEEFCELVHHESPVDCVSLRG